mmetsp:Transcript_1768/g.2843  ORF Transcript_1768/g.2843 Transcript_1768/m.2843 type:complete len:92 (+) Transcript_1768:428-703(+)
MLNVQMLVYVIVRLESVNALKVSPELLVSGSPVQGNMRSVVDMARATASRESQIWIIIAVIFCGTKTIPTAVYAIQDSMVEIAQCEGVNMA